MACNGFNHSPDCQCGWGGVWYGSLGAGGATIEDDSWLFRSPLDRERRAGRQRETWTEWATGDVNPNATCPVCGVPVYYYQSLYGGRVFFDELGPPWPKHPCTDNGTYRAAEPISRAGSNPRSVLQGWMASGWESLVNLNISRVENEKGLFVVEEYSCQYRALGSPLCVGQRLYFAAAQVVSASAVRIKKVAPGQFLISILDYEERRDEWTSWEGFAFVKLDALRASQSYCMRLPLGIRSAQVTRGDLVERLRTLLLGGGVDSRQVLELANLLISHCVTLRRVFQLRGTNDAGRLAIKTEITAMMNEVFKRRLPATCLQAINQALVGIVLEDR